MAFHKTGKVVSYDWAESKKGPYMKATLQEPGENPRMQSIFSEAWQKVIEEAYKLGYTIDWTIDKKEGEQYWNITALSLHQPQGSMKGQAPDPSKAQPEVAPQSIINPQERGMCLKEIGEGLRSGYWEKESKNPAALNLLKAFYMAEIFRGAGFELKM